MKCEICHEAEAETAITLKQDGTERELYVCKACAEKAKAPKAPTPASSKGRPKITVIGNDTKDLPQPLVDGFVKAAFDFMKGVAEVEENEHRRCPVCKRNWDQIKESGRLGCPACWKTFGKKIRTEFLAGQYAASHTGSAPCVERLPDPTAIRTVLERDLKAAIAAEDYRRAAELKQKLDDLSRGEDHA